MIRLSAAAAPRAYPTWHAWLWSGEKRRGAGGRRVPAPARPLAGSAALRSPAALRPPARPPLSIAARPAPGPSSGPPHSRSSAPNQASASLHTNPPLLALRLRLRFLAGCRPGAVRSMVLNPRALPLCARRSRCLAAVSRRPPRLGPTASGRAVGTGHGAGKVTEPQDVDTVPWVPTYKSRGAGSRIGGYHWWDR